MIITYLLFLSTGCIPQEDPNAKTLRIEVLQSAELPEGAKASVRIVGTSGKLTKHLLMDVPGYSDLKLTPGDKNFSIYFTVPVQGSRYVLDSLVG